MKAICRNFQGGSCTYGERCKFLHTQQQQQQRKPNVNGFGGQSNSQNTNPFGFGANSGGSGSNQQQKTNPFGFGMQKSSQLNGGPQSEFKPNQSQRFENKWNRSSSKPQNGTSSSRQSDNNSQQVNHKCTDPEVCKRQIAEDFAQEKPLWILTCYSHCKGTPCDIVGDISYEELRAAAYEDAKKGMNLQAIVEKERNILNSKLVEFNKLLSEPYKRPLNSSFDILNHQSNGANTNAFSVTTPNNGPLSVSSFSQLGTSLNLSSERPSVLPQMNTPAQPSSFVNGGNFMTSNTTNPFGSRISGPQTQSSPFSKPAESTMFGDLTSQFQTPRNPFSIPGELPLLQGSTLGQFQDPSIAFNNSNSTTMLQTTPDVQLNKSQVENVDPSIWLKEKWIPGEIPEEAPPDRFCK